MAKEKSFSFLDTYSTAEEEWILETVQIANERGLEFLDFTKIHVDLKKLTRNLPISKRKHMERNIHMEGMCPETLDQMMILVGLNLFNKFTLGDGFSCTHNIPESYPDTIESRWNVFVSKPLMKENLDFRGVVGSAFEHFHLIYNANTKKIVLDRINKGSYDFLNPNKSALKHFDYDVKPWILWGNDRDDPYKKMMMNPKVLKELEYIYTIKEKMDLDDKEVETKVNSTVSSFLKK